MSNPPNKVSLPPSLEHILNLPIPKPSTLPAPPSQLQLPKSPGEIIHNAQQLKSPAARIESPLRTWDPMNLPKLPLPPGQLPKSLLTLPLPPSTIAGSPAWSPNKSYPTTPSTSAQTVTPTTPAPISSPVKPIPQPLSVSTTPSAPVQPVTIVRPIDLPVSPIRTVPLHPSAIDAIAKSPVRVTSLNDSKFQNGDVDIPVWSPQASPVKKGGVKDLERQIRALQVEKMTAHQETRQQQQLARKFQIEKEQLSQEFRQLEEKLKTVSFEKDQAVTKAQRLQKVVQEKEEKALQNAQEIQRLTLALNQLEVN